MDPLIGYHKTYGGVLGETFDWTRMEEIANAYSELIKILPNNGETK